jgi:CDP-diacylglycerol---serine O-phosphatidyltransferase
MKPFATRPKKRKVFAVLPTMLTLGNAACGFGAITYAANWSQIEPATALFTASCLIYLAMVFDALDGSAARWTKQTSEFGAQLDSLCDAISFGAAPAFLMLQFSQSRDFHLRLLWLIAVLYVVCAVLRLARFNVETDEDDSHNFFRGLPSPAAAGTVASFPVMVYGLKRLERADGTSWWDQFADWLDPVSVKLMPIVTFLVACLMVSRFRYPHLFNQLIRGKRNRKHLIQLVFALAVVFVLPQMSAPILFCWYAFAAPVRATWTRSVVRWWQGGQPVVPPSPPSENVGRIDPER